MIQTQRDCSQRSIQLYHMTRLLHQQRESTFHKTSLTALDYGLYNPRYEHQSNCSVFIIQVHH